MAQAPQHFGSPSASRWCFSSATSWSSPGVVAPEPTGPDTLRPVTEDLADLLAAGERAAFHGRPAAAVAALEQAVALAQSTGRRAEVTAAAWLLGVALAAAGRYGGALRVLSPLVDAGEAGDATAETRLFASFGAASAASVHRGLGRHPAARELDERGLALSDGRPEAMFDANLGLASDAVGLGDLDAARAALATADTLVGGQPAGSWRQRSRLGWTRAEVALLADEPQEAAVVAAAAVEEAERARAPRHVAKGLLFQGVAEVSAGAPAAIATLRRAATLAEGLGALPVVWQARALLGALLAGSPADESARSLAAARSAVLTIAADLPANLRDEWLARPNVSALLEG
jgi:tetratricopeptide (TPR) repeat protein